MLYDVEEDHELYLAPKLAEYSASKGGASRHLLVNGSTERIAVKFKCSNNDLYRVSPVYSCLEPGSSQRVHIVRDPGPAKVDKMVLLYKKTNFKHGRDAFYNFEDFEVKRTLIALVAHDLPQRLKPSSVS
ncbi:hypothetical protein QR680_002104 [Steinernema hermaphroditum]|uniref:Major sperm protein n=1 Tax=Steinernema hermaphroditum TaxID=289476 RepID=A0AA39H418_9BILA|nr:hypothetical protein QR680_002104 [Steinernema hermaphroditum]